MKTTTLTQQIKSKVNKAISNFDKMQEELLEQIANSRSNRSLSRFNDSFESASKSNQLTF
jgi:hypothetical protein